ncbi:heme/hemin ABC transporter substrate-binding protein [Neisseria perflava]|uniref:heme/hemin ABC transporter substrate-binding protein n=1 Tax=Neisseria perflava TaxID=33053 RepID=UPI0020A116A5|nr:ABC transporter substrate-binding protein [Neisseria perflava]MCP1659779.1 iron complex transport system substrate-binding protein [Neisseria perflava]MCP1771622.1 iron complex transport system substrate-binding protein [Neisseria perflava]
MKTYLTTFLLAAALSSAAHAQRIVVITPDVGDIVVALGALDEVVGRDQTVQNTALQSKPSIGIYRNLTVEPIVAAKPDIVLGSWMAQPATIFDSLKKAGIKAVNVAPNDDIAAYPQSIRTTGKLIGKSAQADRLAAKWQADMKPQSVTGKRYLFSYDGRLVAGRNTASDELIKRAGGINAAAAIDGIKLMTREAWLAAKPDIIIIADHNAAKIGGVAKFAAQPEIAASPAAKNGKIYLWKANDMFRYGLDTPQVVQKLHGLAK